MPHNPGNFNTTAPIAYAGQCGPDVVLSPDSGKQLAIGEAVLVNREGNANDVGFAWKQPNSMWVAGQIDASAVPDYIDDTVGAKAGVSDGFAVTTTTNDDGFLAGSTNKFNVIGMTVTTGEGGSPAYVYEYYNGSAMVALPTYFSPAAFTAANHVIAFPAPHDWAKGTTAAVATTLDDYYCVQMVPSTAPTTAVLASTLWLGTLVDFFPQLGDDTALNFEMATEVVIPAGAGIMPCFGLASTGNTIQLHWRPLG